MNYEGTNENFAQDNSGAENASGNGANVVTLSAGADNVVVLPADATLDSIRADGRDLLIEGEDGVVYRIADGAIDVPLIVVDGVAVPPMNLAALLVGAQPDAGPTPGANPQSSGGNFAGDEGEIQPAFDLGNLLPYTELAFPEPEDEEIIPDLADEPVDIVIETPNNPAGVDNAIAEVDEAGLPARGEEPEGTDELSNVETTSGTIIFSTPDGLASISLDGVEITSVGQTFAGTYGTLTITSIDLASGTIGFSYTLEDNTLDDAEVDSFVATVVDTDGDTADATLNVTIIDDEPQLAPDTDTVAAGTYGPETGNVLTGEGTTSGAAGADQVGADDAEVTAIASDAGGTVQLAEGSAQITGDYGTLTIFADGSYSYVRDAGTPGGVTETFTYTVTDGDGDDPSTTLTIDIENLTTTISIIPDPEGGTEVDEAGLPPRDGDEPVGSGEGQDGDPNNNSDPSETVTGTITWVDGDDPNVIEIDGVVVTGPGQEIPIEGGTLTIITFDPDANVIEYNYTLDDNTAGDDTSATFTVTVTDVDGDTASDDITIDIIDDVPTAVNDTDSLTEGGPITATGNVITDAEANGDNGADTVGADGAQVQTPGVFNGTYGDLTLGADGEYSYTLTPFGIATLATLGDGESLPDEVFDYVLVDGDGDTSPATLTISLNGEDDDVTINGLDGQAPEVSLDEDDLANPGDDQGSDQSDPLTKGGNFEVVSPDGLDDVQVNSVDVVIDGVFQGSTEVANDGVYSVTITGWTPVYAIPGDDTTPVVSATFTYSATLLDNTLAHTGLDDAALVNMLSVTADDTDGSSDSAVLDVEIVDDVPTAVNDTDSLTEGGPITATGNV
ncbi:beta strand repeat-containing protein, partial [Altererythrobacter sp. MF3-039]|uniref:beta strand repeat-containing protein n=1 Tax=Altererythrobacter sp. MF3-039 TaxID=3252901 RepID=UPI00390C8D31